MKLSKNLVVSFFCIIFVLLNENNLKILKIWIKLNKLEMSKLKK